MGMGCALHHLNVSLEGFKPFGVGNQMLIVINKDV